MGLAFMNGPTSGENVFIPLDWVIGGPKMVGKGWRMLMECLSIGRSISLPALSAAVGRLTYFSTGIYAQLRKQFKVPLGSFEGVQEVMAKIAGNTYLLEASRRMTAGAVDLNVKPSVVSAIQKYHATELARTMSDAAMDVHAGRAVQLGPRNYLGQLQMSLPIAITVEGANILTRNLIIFGQGAIRCHPYVLQEMAAANDSNPKTAIKKFDRLLLSHIGYTTSNIVRALTMGLSKAKFVRAPHKAKSLAYYYRQLTRMSNALALCSDFAMLILGGMLKRKERLSARLGDMLSYLYLATTVLKYYADEGYPSEDLDTVHWCLQTALVKIQVACDEFLRNFPNRFVAGCLRAVIFPCGQAYRLPSDKLESKLVATMMQPSALRERLTANVFVKNSADDCLGRIAAAFVAANETQTIQATIKQAIREKKLRYYEDNQQQCEAAQAANIISKADAEKLVNAERLIHDAMEVDAFAPDYLRNK
jgi:alkylation response protein AidB-like acyl-CoA dehydrogenase